MNIEQFDKHFGHLKDSDKIAVDPMCDQPEHESTGNVIGRGSARRNVLKHGGDQFICRGCHMRHCNPMRQEGPKRQTSEIIDVTCPECGICRQMRKACYYGEMTQLYQQVCGSCAQKGRKVSEGRRKAISQTLSGRRLSDTHKENIRLSFHRDPYRKEQALKNVKPGIGGGWNKGKKTPKEVRQKISEANKGFKRTKAQRRNISRGRKKMLAEQGGFIQDNDWPKIV